MQVHLGYAHPVQLGLMHGPPYQLILRDLEPNPAQNTVK